MLRILANTNFVGGANLWAMDCLLLEQKEVKNYGAHTVKVHIWGSTALIN